MIPKSIGPADFWYALAMAGVFAGFLLLVSLLSRLVITPWQRRRGVAKRVQEERLISLAKEGMFRSDYEGPKNLILRTVERIFSRERLLSLQRTLLQADIYTSLPHFIYIVILSGVAGFLVGWWLFRLLIWEVALGLAGGCLPFLYLRIRKVKKARRIEAQMPDAMELLARSLRAGHTLAGSVELAAQEIDHPLGSEMRLAHEEQRLGLSMPEALEHMAARTTSKDLRYFVSAITIQHEVGGNLAELMETLGSLIRSRLNLKAKVFALTSQARASATVLAILPFVIFFLVYRNNPAYAGVLLTDPAGRNLLFGGVVCIALGSIIMRKMADIKV